MNIRSIFNKGLLLVAAALVAPLLTLASPTPTCTDQTPGPSFGDTLTATTPVTFTDNTLSGSQTVDATFTCMGVIFPSNFIFGNADLVTTFASTFIISSDVPFPDITVVFTGTDTATLKPIQFYVSDLGSTSEQVSMTPEPGSILLFGTGLLIAGGFIRRRMLAHTPASY